VGYPAEREVGELGIASECCPLHAIVLGMEFSYEISEQDYVRGCKLARRSSKGALAKTIIFWLVVIAALMLLFSVVRRSSLSSAARDSQVEIESEPEPAPVNTSTALQNFGLRVAPLAGVALIWAFLMLYWVPSLQRRQYRKDTNVHGVITVGIDSEAFSFRSSAGTSLRSGWDASAALPCGDVSMYQRIGFIRYGTV
jgi:hypothetical protein